MKWLVGVVVFAVLAAGALFGVGYFVLPATSAVARTVEIDRPRSIIFPLLANLRTFNEYSPWFDRDPKADYIFTGPRAGVGQTARWSSSVPAVGGGEQTITAVTQSDEVRTKLVLHGAAAESSWKLTAGRNGATAVTWTLSFPCGQAPESVICRYVNIVNAATMASQVDFGLQRLKKLAEELPALDIEQLKPEFVTVSAQDFAYVEGETTQDDAAVDAAIVQSLTTYVGPFLRQNGLTQAGPPLAVTTTWANDKFAFRAGAPFQGAIPLVQVGAKVGKTPGGQALKVTHTGPRASMRPVYARIEAYMRANRLDQAGAPWEVFLDDPATPDQAGRRTEIYFPIR
ncbi:MAG: SRPBCC family protein [Hyphomonadaceae bacterium]